MTIKDSLLSFAASTMLGFKSRPAIVRRKLAEQKYKRAEPPTRDSVTVGAVQMHLDLLDDGAAFAIKYYDLVRQAVERGAQLIVFPEYAWLPILGLLPPVRQLADEGVTLNGAVEKLAPGGGLTLEGVFRMIAPAVKSVFETTASELAAHFGVYLMPGTALTTDKEGHLFNTSYLYGPDGQLIGTQNKLHPTPMEADWMTCGSTLDVWSLPFTKVAAPVCMDFTYWEITRIATLRGAEILLDMKADEEGSQPYMAARGVQARVQESFAYGVGAYCVTQLFGLNFSGPSFIVAPLGVRSDSTILLAKTQTPHREEIITAELDLARLRKFCADHPHDFNVAAYQKYLPPSYQAYRERVTQDIKKTPGSATS